MTEMSRVLAFKTKLAANEAIWFWKGKGYLVAVAGPTDAVQLSSGPGDDDTWESGGDADWYIVIATKTNLQIIGNADAGSWRKP